MTTETIEIAQSKQEFQFWHVLPISVGHLINDLYTSCIAPLLPVIIEKLSLSLTAVGSLIAIMQLPSMLNPFIGYLADKASLRYFVILTPAITATLISSMGFASNYFSLAIIFFTTGISIACFHAPAPAMISRVSGRQIGLGMSLFMAGGELARTIGPLLAVWAVSTWTLEGIYRLVVLGWAASIVLYLRLRDIPARMGKPGSLKGLYPVLRTLFLPLFFVILLQNFLRECLSTFLPTYMYLGGGSLWESGQALFFYELAGVAGALVGGTLSDKLGRRLILILVAILAPIFMFIFLQIEGRMIVPVLLALGFTSLSTLPVIMAMVQDYVPSHRAMGNGLYMFMTFALRPIALLGIGYLGDQIGLEQVFYWSAWISLLSIPAILALPTKPKPSF